MQHGSFTSTTQDNDSCVACCAVILPLALYAIGGGILTLIGWLTNIPRLTDWNNEGISMFPNTAACAALAGAALLFLNGLWSPLDNRLVVRVLAILIAGVGGLTLFEHITQVNVGIDTLISDRSWGQRASMSHMRMGPPAASAFTVLSCGLFLATCNRRYRRAASILALGVVLIVSLSLIGYWYRADQLYLVPRFTGIAWQTSTILACLGIALIASIPEHGIVAILRRDDAGGTLARRLMVPIVGIPLLLGWLRIMGQNANFYDTAFGTAVRTLVEIMLLGGMLWWTAAGLSRQAQIARLAQEAIREAARRKDEFLATLAHELRNPLAPIGNSLEIIKHSGGNAELLDQARDTMERQFAQMVRLVDDLLDVGRITRDKLELRTQELNLAPVIDQAVEICRPLADKSCHRLEVLLPPSPIWVQGDSVRLAQVFSNLLNNACKFTEPGGTIRIEASQQADQAIVTVQDSGIGIAPDQLSRIFEMFSQVDTSIERTRSGLGIGLTLAKRLVELHGGTIEAKSEGLGKGSTLVVHLPVLHRKAAMPGTAPQKTVNGTAPRRILITDDNRDAAKTVAMLLRLNGHEVSTAFDGPSAIEQTAEFKPDILLLDIGLPGMNGYQVCREIRTQPWGKNVRIVALTGWGQDQDRQNAREAGFDDHLVKPVDPEVLRRSIAAYSPTNGSKS